MTPLVEFPELVKHYAPYFVDLFSEEAFVEFERYISGLIVSENKTVESINRLFVNESRNQSSLNRLLTCSPYQVSEINQARLKLLADLNWFFYETRSFSYSGSNSNFGQSRLTTASES